MEDILDDKKNIDLTNSKLDKFAFTSILLVIIFITYKFIIYFIHSIQVDSVLIPNYVNTFPFKVSFASGAILCISLLITFYLYKIKKFQTVIALNTIFIVQGIALPYILHFSNI